MNKSSPPLGFVMSIWYMYVQGIFILHECRRRNWGEGGKREDASTSCDRGQSVIAGARSDIY